jgi:hypothetical protein
MDAKPSKADLHASLDRSAERSEELQPAPQFLLDLKACPLKQFFTADDDTADRYRRFESALQEFVASSMDEVRLARANECARLILDVSDLLDIDLLREAVLKREASGTITYKGQRDHSAHTLNNWLLGWHIYSKCSRFNEAMNEAIKMRGWPSEVLSYDDYFGHMWQFTGLLHDVGYAFEGGLSSLDPATQSSQANVGLRLLDDYFSTRLFLDCGIRSAHEQRQLFNELDIALPEYPNEASLNRIAFLLRDLGDVSALSRNVRRRVHQLNSEGATIKTVDDFFGDAFELWELNYRTFGANQMAERIRQVELVFQEYAHKGLSGTGVRVLDHAVCSGLMLLKISTFYYVLRSAIEEKRESGAEISPVAAKFVDRSVSYPYDSAFWWTGIVWATASAAMHNIFQAKRPWIKGVSPHPLKLREDPLTYLGILVDLLQEWDRYFVFRVFDRLPVQGNEVFLGMSGGRLRIRFQDAERAIKVEKELNLALEDWEELLELQPPL